MSGEVDDLVMYLIVTLNDKTYVAAAGRVTQRKGLRSTVLFILKVMEVNVTTRILKTQNPVAESTVLFTVVPRMLFQAPMSLAWRNGRFSKAPWLLTIPRSFLSFAESWYFPHPTYPL